MTGQPGRLAAPQEAFSIHATIVDKPTKVDNQATIVAFDKSTPLGTTGRVDTLESRLQWIVEHRHEFSNLVQLSLAAGLSHSTIHNLVKKERTQGRISPRSETLAKIARAANVPLDWLASGIGSPASSAEIDPEPAHARYDEEPARVVERPDRYAHATKVIRALVEDGYDAGDVRRAVGFIAFDEGQEGSDQLDLYRAAKRVLDTERGRPELGVREVGEDEF